MLRRTNWIERIVREEEGGDTPAPSGGRMPVPKVEPPVVDDSAGEDTGGEVVASEDEDDPEPAGGGESEPAVGSPSLYSTLRENGVDLGGLLGDYEPTSDEELVDLLGGRIDLLEQNWSRLSDWEQNRSGYQQWLADQQRQQAGETQPAAKTEQKKSGWNPPTVSEGVYDFVEPDPETGLFRAKFPGHEQAAIEANKLQAYRQRMAQQFIEDPLAYFDTVFAGKVEEMVQSRLADYQPLVQDRETQQWNQALEPYRGQVYDNTGRVTAAGQRFQEMLDQYWGLDIPMEDKIQFAAVKAGLSGQISNPGTQGTVQPGAAPSLGQPAAAAPAPQPGVVPPADPAQNPAETNQKHKKNALRRAMAVDSAVENHRPQESSNRMALRSQMFAEMAEKAAQARA